MPAAVEVTGKNGAIPDPEGDALACAIHVLISSVYYWEVRTSIAKLRVLLHDDGFARKGLRMGDGEG